MPIHVRLLGSPEVVFDGRATPFRPERRYQLLAWLALHGCPLERDRVAALFWVDRDNATARRNLRKLVFDAQAFDWAAGLAGDRGALWWRVDTDAARFDLALAEGRLDEAIALYRGPLCDGLEDARNAALAEALRFERKRAAERWRAAVLALLARPDSAPAARLGLAQRLLAADPLDEEAAAAAMRAHDALGSAAEAARLFREFAERLAETLGVEPSAQLRDLARQLASGVGARRVVAAPAPRPAGPSFVGRAAELAELSALLGRAECRLLTITGPGGMGKSRLAKAALPSLETRFADGVWWIPLDDLDSAAQVAPRMGEVLDIELAGKSATLDAVAAALARRQAMLVLDNAEQVDGLAAAIDRLLERAPHLKLVATSRRRLGATGEWLLPLAGLPAPPGDGSDARAETFDAVRLFDAHARAALPSFDLVREADTVARLVRRLGGLPLAIELAARWVRLLPVAEIDAELGRSLDVLERDDEGDERPEHRSVQATFGGSWRLLAPREQHSLARLAVFAGPFSRAAANEVAGASLPLLAALFDKSLIQAAPEGRFSLHPLVRQYARARLDPSAAAEAHGRLLAYFASELARDGGRRADATADAGIGHDLPNIVAAWAVAVGRADAAALRDMTLPLLRWFERTGRWQELGALVDAALAALDQTEAAHGTAFARLLRSKAAVLGRQGRLDDALDAARHALRLARRLRDRAAVRANLGTIGNCLVLLGRRAQARHCFELALAQARADRDVADIASNTNNLATIEKQVGRYDRALPLYRESLALKRELGEMRGVAVALHNIGNLYRALQQWADAVPFLEEGLAVCEAHGLSSVRPSLLANLGATRLQLGQVEGATRLLERALAAVRESGERHIEAFTRLTLIKVALAAGDVPRARQDLAEALRVAQAMGSSPYLLEGLMAYAMVLEHEGERERAAAYCLFVAGHDAVNEADRVGTLQQLEALRLGPSQRQRAADAARAMPALDHAVAAVLHEASGDATAAAVTA